MPKSKNKSPRTEPRNVRPEVRRAVLLEAGYNCVNPVCRIPLIHVHHIDYVENGGPDTEENLIALCPNCHARVHMGNIPEEAIRTWKTMVVMANHAWAKETLNALLFLDTELSQGLYLTGDGVVRFTDLLVAGLAEAKHVDFVGPRQNVFLLPGLANYAIPGSELAKSAYQVRLTAKGLALVSAWKNGALDKLTGALSVNDETAA